MTAGPYITIDPTQATAVPFLCTYVCMMHMTAM